MGLTNYEYVGGASLNITNEVNRKYVQEFKRTSSNTRLGNQIREDVFLGRDKRSFIKQNVIVFCLISLVSIGFMRVFLLFEGFMGSGDILRLIMVTLPFLILLHVSIRVVYLFIESRMESNKQLSSAKEIKLVSKTVIRSRSRRISRSDGNRVSNRFGKHIYSYYYMLNNGGDDIAIKVDGRDNFHRFDKGDLVPVYMVTKKWWIFRKDELVVYFEKNS